MARFIEVTDRGCTNRENKARLINLDSIKYIYLEPDSNGNYYIVPFGMHVDKKDFDRIINAIRSDLVQ